MVLHKELSFFFMHKLNGNSDDAHLYYKRKLAERWHNILGEPPDSWNDRTLWMKEIADAPRTTQDAIRQLTILGELLEQLEKSSMDYEESSLSAERLLAQIAQLESIKQHSLVASETGLEESLRSQSPYFNQLDLLYNDPKYTSAWQLLLATYRKQVLKDEYNMDPQLMYEYTKIGGPLDWRHPQTHAFYWARRGAEVGKGRFKTEDVYKILNTDRVQLQALQALARSGRISYDPFSKEVPGRFPDPRFIDAVIGDEKS